MSEYSVEIIRVAEKSGQFGPYLGVTAYATKKGLRTTPKKVWFAAPAESGLEAGRVVDIVAESEEPKDSITFLNKVRKAGEPAPPTQERAKIENVERIVALLELASGELKYPKITFALEDGTKIKLYRAGERSRYHGDVQVVEAGKAFGEGKYFGRIHGAEFIPGRDSNEVVVEALRAFAADPSGYARTYGRRTSNCCFCNTVIRTNESLHAGYGPICAERYGLPWGEVA